MLEALRRWIYRLLTYRDRQRRRRLLKKLKSAMQANYMNFPRVKKGLESLHTAYSGTAKIRDFSRREILKKEHRHTIRRAY